MGLRQGRRNLLTLGVSMIAASASHASMPPTTPPPSPGVAVSRALASQRAARVTNLHYALRLSLAEHARTMPGQEQLRFTLASEGTQEPLALDFREGTIVSATLNGTAIPTSLTDGHLMLPGSALKAGENTVAIDFASPVETSGTAITRYEDKDDGTEYLYSLFVPMDASMAFPCFDQPDLKAGFTLTVEAPAAWTIIANTAASAAADRHGDKAITTFPETRPISTYLFAFAAGPWQRVHPTPGLPDVYVRKSQVARAEPEVPELQTITQRGTEWLTKYFQQPFPFPKYDIVLVPGFPFGGMEHAGATFLREDVVLFRTAPTAADRFSRDITTLHELTHQWFGDLVTMRWFDDLWLKEGFAQYMAYRCLDTLEPSTNAWKHFFEDIKPQAYGIDETEGTTPIFQDIPNLKDAKSAYGAIVYQKAPAILKQLEFRLGPEAFERGLRTYLARHAYANAQWADLIDALHQSSGQDVRSWADAWVLRRGMPEVTASFSCSAGKLASLTLHQHDVLPDELLWPMSMEVRLGYADAHAPVTLRADLSSSDAPVPEAAGRPCPAFVFANAGDHAYGRFLFDEKSEAAVRAGIHANTLANDDPLLRSMLWGALWENVHVARSAPREFVQLALDDLPHEADETLARILGARSTVALQRYMTRTQRAALTARGESVFTERMLHGPAAGMRIISFRSLTSVAESSAARATLKDLLSGKLAVPGVELRQLDRWNLVGKLIGLNDPEADAIFAAEQKLDSSGEGQKYAWAVQAGRPDAAVKARYFSEYARSPKDAAAKPEDWLTQSLRPFNAWNQTELTEPYVRRALDQLREIKRDRKIFFLGAWLSAFLTPQTSPAAEAAVHAWLAQRGTDPDLRRKVLENADELQRTVRIRAKFPQ